MNGYNAEAAEFEIKRLQECCERYCARIADLEQSVRTMHADASALTVERDRYRYALDRITCEPPAYGADMLMIARDALKTRE